MLKPYNVKVPASMFPDWNENLSFLIAASIRPDVEFAITPVVITGMFVPSNAAHR